MTKILINADGVISLIVAFKPILSICCWPSPWTYLVLTLAWPWTSADIPWPVDNDVALGE